MSQVGDVIYDSNGNILGTVTQVGVGSTIPAAQPQLGPGQGSAGGSGIPTLQSSGAGFQSGGGAAGGIYGGIGISSTIHFPGLSTDELKELEILEQTYKEEAKQKQLNSFKKIPATMRQHIVDVLEWDAKIDQMDAEASECSQRLQELRSRNFNPMSSQAWYPGVHAPGQITTWPAPGRMRLPAHLTLEDVKQAHAERSLEEEVLGVPDNE